MVGQLKLAVCARERRLAVTILEIRGLNQQVSQRSSVYVRLSLCPDDQMKERYKTKAVPVCVQSTVIQETHTFELSKGAANRRLLISAWQKFEHREKSEFIGCMSFSARKLKSQQKSIHGWYQFLGELLGRRKHLAAEKATQGRVPPRSRLGNIDENAAKESSVEAIRDKDYDREVLQPHRSHDPNAEMGMQPQEDIRKRCDVGLGENVGRNVSACDQENIVGNQRPHKPTAARRRRRELRPRNSPCYARYLTETGKHAIRRSRARVDHSAARRKSPKSAPCRRAPRDFFGSPTLVVQPAPVRSNRSKSARIVSQRRRPSTEAALGRIPPPVLQVLYSDEYASLGLTHVASTVLLNDHVKPVPTLPTLDNLTTASLCGKAAQNVDRPAKRHSLYAASNWNTNGNNNKEVPDFADACIDRPGVSGIMYVENGLATETIFNNSLTMTKTGRVRAKKQHVRMAAYLRSQKAFMAECDDRERKRNESAKETHPQENATDHHTSGGGFALRGRYWREVSSSVDDDRGYCSDPAFDDEIVEVVRVPSSQSFGEEPALFPPAGSPPKYTHSSLKHVDDLERFADIKSQMELLTLDDMSGIHTSEDRECSSYFIALLDPTGAKKKYSSSEEEEHLFSPIRETRYSTQKSVVLDLKRTGATDRPTDENRNELDRDSLSELRDRSTSLCSQRSYVIKQRNKIFPGLRRVTCRKDLCLPTTKAQLHPTNTTEKHDTVDVVQVSKKDCISAKSPLVRSVSVPYGKRQALAKVAADLYMTMGRSPTPSKSDDSGVYVQLSQYNGEENSPDCGLQMRQLDGIDETGKANRKFSPLSRAPGRPDAYENSPPVFKRSASVSEKSAWRTRPSRSSTRSDLISKGRKSSDEKDSPTLRRNSFSNGRRSFIRKSRRSFKHHGCDENVKPTDPTLDELLGSKCGTRAFRSFLKSEHSEENLDFWLDCECYRSQKVSKRHKVAFKIFNRYLAPSAPHEINIDYETRARTEEKLKNLDHDTFLEPQSCIFSLMKCDSFRRFLMSDAYFKLQPLISLDINKNQQSNESRSSGMKLNFKTSLKRKKSTPR